MLCTLVAVYLFFGPVLADPVPEISPSSANEFGLMSALLHTESTDVAAARVEPTVVFDLLSAVISSKFSALQTAVDTIDWLVSNSAIIALGLVVTLGFCKLTDKCNFEYEQYVPSSMAQFRSLATPERLDQAEQFFVTAVEKYAEKRKRRML